MIKTQIFIGAALFAGVAIGYFAGGHGGVDETAESDSSYVAKKTISDRGDAASVKALRRRIAELEKLLAAQGEKSDVAISNAEAGGVPREPPRPGNPQAWLENLKKNDPARYAQMTNRFARWRQRWAEQTQSRLEFLSSIDVSRMSAKAQDTHNALMDLMVQRDEIMDRLHAEGVTDSERRQLFEQMRETDRELGKLSGQERSNLIREAARNSGVKGKMVQELTDTIKDVIEATDNGRGGHYGPPPGGPGGR